MTHAPKGVKSEDDDADEAEASSNSWYNPVSNLKQVAGSIIHIRIK